ncbi:MAG: NAD(P)-dependent oxidoreductase [Methylobacteriaceae bacterium]|nr:NAD(P)-dependent oxidoreductase [Methylobacteriaceae bacterium]
MTILVTGSAGRIGGRLVETLLARGARVRGFDLRPSGRAHAAYEEVVGAFADVEAAATATAGVATIFHLGAFMSWLAADQAKLFAANVEGTRVLLEAAGRAGARRFIFASSGEVYPENVPAYLPIDESHPLQPRSAYGLTKLIGEEMTRWAARSGLATTILRFSHTQEATELLDPDSFFSGPRFFLQPRIRQQEAFGAHAAVAALRAVDDGTPALVLARNARGRPFRMHITDARDMVSGLLAAHDSAATIGETYNLGATEPVDFEAALARMAEITGLPVRTVDLPGDGVWYETSNRKLREATGWAPAWPFARMLEDAADAWRARRRS